ncbi:MAG: glycosyltransferase family 1 protein [bacterium]|nr:glycosyltransferase family 1 protein [bacterium]
MKVAILGTRGVPASYGGFETLAEELGRRLVDRGHDVTVYGRRGFVDRDLKTFLGMSLVVLPRIASKHLETVTHTLISAVHAVLKSYDAVLVCNAANAPWVRILQLGGIPVALNVDGLERKRRKWGLAGRCYYRVCERLAAALPDTIITDAAVIQRYYRRSYRAPSRMIAYGGDLEPPRGTDQLAALGLKPSDYVLYVSRFEPENNPDRVVAAYSKVGGSRPLVMLGSARYAPDLEARLRDVADRRVVFPGAIYGEGYRQLLFNCRLYIHATEVGGTHPALVEAMGAGRPIAYYDTPENREVAGGAGLSFRFSGDRGLENVLDSILEQPERLDKLASRSKAQVKERYCWDKVADAYEHVLGELC